MMPPVVVLLLLLCVAPLHAVVVPTRLFGDNMVLAAESSPRLWGTASPGEHIRLDGYGESSFTTLADKAGKWNFTLPTLPTPPSPDNNMTLALSGSSGTVLKAHNVSMGTVVLCSGQSNMALNLHPIYDNVSIINSAFHPNFRLFQMPEVGTQTPQGSIPSTVAWQQTTPTTISSFSGLCYLSILHLEKARVAAGSVPRVYGLIEAAVGSTDIMSWMSEEQRDTTQKTCWQPAGSPLPPSNSHAPGNETASSELWNAMVAPLATGSYGVSAMLWDQGENNAAGGWTRQQYNCALRTMFTMWRRAFKSDVPVVFVQLGGYESDTNFIIRSAISDTAVSPLYSNITGRGLPQSAMVTTYDLLSPQFEKPSNPFWIHARNKSEIGRRIALQLSRLLNDTESVGQEYQGPVVAATKLSHLSDQRPVAEVTFSHAAGLGLRPAQHCIRCCKQLDTRTPDTPTVFEVANRAGKWFKATGSVSEGVLRVEPAVNVTGNWLSAVRYAMLDVPECVLYNSIAVSAGPFEIPVPFTAPQ
eukprot:Hpha_TRINITY_DN31340_c0_g1::TRINITY_DN31340_c0_g1_i1::g.194455::m.194455/K05970/SIAE; sialate O-acetylesterase